MVTRTLHRRGSALGVDVGRCNRRRPLPLGATETLSPAAERRLIALPADGRVDFAASRWPSGGSVVGIAAVLACAFTVGGCGDRETSDARLDPRPDATADIAAGASGSRPVADASLETMAAGADPGSAVNAMITEADLGDAAAMVADQAAAFEAYAQLQASRAGNDPFTSPPVAAATGSGTSGDAAPVRPLQFQPSGAASNGARVPVADGSIDSVATGADLAGDISGPDAPGATPNPAASDASSPTSAAVPAPVDTRGDAQAELSSVLDELIEMLTVTASESPDPLRYMLVAAALDGLMRPEGAGATGTSVAERTGLARAAVSRALADGRLPAQQQAVLESFDRFFAAASRQAEEDGDPARFVPAIEALRDEFAVPPSLSIPAFKLCSRVSNYGNYNEIPGSAFIRGEPIHLVCYIELDHFTSREAPDRRYWITSVSLEIDLYAADGTRVHTEAEEVAEDYCLNKRRDFYLTRSIVLPGNLNLGAYSLKARVRDMATGAIAEANLPISIVATKAVANADSR